MITVAYHSARRVFLQSLSFPEPCIGGDVQAYDHRAACGYVLQVFLHPAELRLREVTDIAMSPTGEEYIIQHDIMHLTPVERKVTRTKQLPELLLRTFICSGGISHIMITDHLEERNAGYFYCPGIVIKEIETIMHQVAYGNAVHRDIAQGPDLCSRIRRRYIH